MTYAKARSRVVSLLRCERGHTLPELLTVLAILGVVVGALAASFASGMATEVDQVRREQAFANARLALQRMRVDIHCASGVTAVDENPYGGYTLTLTENNDQQTGWCPGVIPAGSDSSGVQWCTIPRGGSPVRFTLYRFLGINPTDCNGGPGSTFEVDYLAQPPSGWPVNTTVLPTPTSSIGNIWPTPVPCAAGRLPTVGVDLNVAVDPVEYQKERYQLRDAIALRNASTGC